MTKSKNDNIITCHCHNSKKKKKKKKSRNIIRDFWNKKTPFKMSEGAGELSPVSDEDVFPTPNVSSSSMVKTAVTEMDTLTAPQLRLFLCGLSV